MATKGSAELETALVRELARYWAGLNLEHFRGALKPPVMALSETASRLGAWERQTRTITIQRDLVLKHPWGVVLEVLKHEMAHQYAHEVLGAIDETAHGPAFRSVCERLGIDAASHGLPTASAPDGPEARVVRRITRLLALAESPNENEASAAMNAARKLMLEHNLSDVSERHYGFRQLGQTSTRVTEYERRLANILSEHFFVQAIWASGYDVSTGKNGRILEICGSRENLDLAEYVYVFLLDTAWRLWKDHKRAAGVAGERERQRFTSGVMLGFADKLAEGAAKNRQEGLVWVGDAKLDDFFHVRHPRMRTIKFGGGPRTETMEEGRAQGRRIVLHKPVTAEAGNRGRLIGGE
jgi:hypothetical protein